MIRSVRFKIFVVFLVLLFCFQGIYLLLNTFFIEDLFMDANRKSMTQAHTALANYIEAGMSIEDAVDLISTDYGFMPSIVGEEMVIVYSIAPHMQSLQRGNIPSQDPLGLHPRPEGQPPLNPNPQGAPLPNSMGAQDARLPIEIARLVRELRQSPSEENMFAVSSRPGTTDDEVIQFIGRLQEDQFMIIEKGTSGIIDSSDMVTRIINLAIVGTFVLGSLIVFFLSGRLAKPFIQMNEAALSISELNFDKKLDIKSNDEIGTLAKSINSISDKLNAALSDLRSANTQLQKDIEYEKAMDQMRRKFVSSVSHEFKTPISMIQGYAEGLKFNIAKNKEDQDYYCEVIIEETDKMNRLIHDLLDLSSYEAGQFKVKPVNFDLSYLVRENIEKFDRRLKEKNVQFETHLTETSMVLADEMRIEQVLTNYMSNALKHVNDGGIIRVELIENLDNYCYRVFNSGQLIAENELENIWTSFYKLESRSEKLLEGTGLGLAIVRAIMELHEGTYGVVNKENGVEFWITIPKQT